MTNTICPIKLHIAPVSYSDNVQVVATFENGFSSTWGEAKTERGAKMILTKHAKRLGLTKSKDGFFAA